MAANLYSFTNSERPESAAWSPGRRRRLPTRILDPKEPVAKVRCMTHQLLAVDLATTLAIAIESLSTTSSASFDIATFDM